MIDLHCHILPGVDDGAQSLEESIGMCSIAQSEGITHIVATPHDQNGIYENSRQSIIEGVANLNLALREKGIAVEILPGADIALDANIIARHERKELMTINDTGKFILIEVSNFFSPQAMRNQIFELEGKRLSLVLTHPERNNALMEEFDLLFDLANNGTIMQITAGSITGVFGPKAQRNAIRLIEARMAHIIATDAHNLGKRSPAVRDAISFLNEKVGPEETLQMTTGRAARIIEGKMPRLPDPVKVKKKRSLFSRLFSLRSSSRD